MNWRMVGTKNPGCYREVSIRIKCMDWHMVRTKNYMYFCCREVTVSGGSTVFIVIMCGSRRYPYLPWNAQNFTDDFHSLFQYSK